jgi:hypothetical protein
MTDHGYTVDHNAVITAAHQLGELQGHAAGIIALAKDANPEWYIWGLVGLPFVPWYWSVADELYKHLDMMGRSLADKAQALHATAANYRGAEEALRNSLQSIEDLLG